MYQCYYSGSGTIIRIRTAPDPQLILLLPGFVLFYFNSIYFKLQLSLSANTNNIFVSNRNFLLLSPFGFNLVSSASIRSVTFWNTNLRNDTTVLANTNIYIHCTGWTVIPRTTDYYTLYNRRHFLACSFWWII